MTDLAVRKAALRARVLARRDAEPDRGERSRLIAARVLDLPEMERAECVAAFVGVRSEVETTGLVSHLLGRGCRVVLPRVEGGDLDLVEIRDLDELVDAPFGLREPPAVLAADPARRLEASCCGIVLVPGVAFDAHGGRLGHGKGYYDRLLRRLPAERPRVAIAFECQVVDDVPMGPSDERMDVLVTETAVRRITPARTALADR